MPPPGLPFYYDDLPDGSFRYKPWVRRGFKILGRVALDYAKRRATEWASETGKRIWNRVPSLPPSKHLRGSGDAPPTIPYTGHQSDQVIISQENMGGKRSSGSAAGGNLSQAKKTAKMINGGSSSRSTGVVPAMFMPGRGAEVPGVVSTYSRPLKRSGGRGPDKVSSVRKQFQAWDGAKCTNDFAFKMVLPASTFVSSGILDPLQRITRFVVNNVFRHKNSAACDPNPATHVNAGTLEESVNQINFSGWTGMSTGHNAYGAAAGAPGFTAGISTDWNYTLGPDATFARQVPPKGALQVGTNSSLVGLAENVITPYRNPQNGSYMYSTLCMQTLENVGWNLNPMKIRRPTNVALDDAGASTYDPLSTFQIDSVVKCYANAPWNDGPTWKGTFPCTYSGWKWCQSFPNRQLSEHPNQLTVSPNLQDPMGTVTGNPSSLSYTDTTTKYQSQFGPGSLSYTFGNNSSAPCVIDIVVHTIKKGKVVNSLSIPVLDQVNKGINEFPVPTVPPTLSTFDTLGQTYSANYLQKELARVGAVNLLGRAPIGLDVLYDAKTPFLPASCLKIAPNTKSDVNFSSATPTKAFTGVPFKQDCRDQFVIAAGSQKSWTFSLPSMNYDASKYRQGGGPKKGLAGDDPVNPQSWDIYVTNAASGSPGRITNCPENDYAICDDLSYIVTIGCSALPTVVVENGISVLDRQSGGVNVSVTGTYKESPLPVYAKEVSSKWYSNSALSRPGYYLTAPPTAHADLLSLGSAVRDETTASSIIDAAPLSTLSTA